MAQVLVGASAIYALIDKDDSYHSRAVAILRSLPRHGLSPFLTNFIVAESHALLLSRLGAQTARAWLLNQNWPIEPVSLVNEEKAK